MGRHHTIAETELDQAELPDDATQVRRADGAAGARAAEALRRQGETARLLLGKIVAGHFASSVLHQAERQRRVYFQRVRASRRPSEDVAPIREPHVCVSWQGQLR